MNFKQLELSIIEERLKSNNNKINVYINTLNNAFRVKRFIDIISNERIIFVELLNGSEQIIFLNQITGIGIEKSDYKSFEI